MTEGDRSKDQTAQKPVRLDAKAMSPLGQAYVLEGFGAGSLWATDFDPSATCDDVKTVGSTSYSSGWVEVACFKVDLNPLNRSGAEGVAILHKEGGKLDTRIYSSDMAPNLPHAQHIHGMAQAISECPTLAADQNGDGLVNTAEGLPSYGPIQVSLTTKGDTSPDSALAVSRFPVANSGGFMDYERTFSVPDSVRRNLGKFAIVQHGVDLNHNGRYDFEAAGASELDPSLPQEATIPANCGVIDPIR